MSPDGAATVSVWLLNGDEEGNSIDSNTDFSIFLLLSDLKLSLWGVGVGLGGGGG